MSTWTRVTIDTLVDVKADNATILGNYLSLLNQIECIFNDMISNNVTLEQSLLQLDATVVSEGMLIGSAVSTYNTLLVNYANTLNTLLDMKVPSVSGIAANLIQEWSATQQTYTYNITFKLPQYNWVYNAPSTVIDNMLVGSIVPCPVLVDSIAPNLVINIGCSTINIPQFVMPASPANADYIAFQELLTQVVPTLLHLLTSHFVKNMTIIDSNVAQINHLIQVYGLM